MGLLEGFEFPPAQENKTIMTATTDILIFMITIFKVHYFVFNKVNKFRVFCFFSEGGILIPDVNIYSMSVNL